MTMLTTKRGSNIFSGKFFAGIAGFVKLPFNQFVNKIHKFELPARISMFTAIAANLTISS